MKKIIGYMFLLGSMNSMAEVVKDRIHSVVNVPGSQVKLVKFENGRVAYLEGNTKDLAGEVNKFKRRPVVAELDKNSRLMAFYPITDLKNQSELMETEENPPLFEPTVVENMKELKLLFDDFNSDYKRRSECSDRAHVWAWEMFKQKGIKSEKVYALFTATWIIKTRLKWWFHVAPLVSVKTPQGVEKMVMDFMFNDRPLSIKAWTDNMVFDLRACKMTKKFSEYDVNPQTEACYMMIDNMYYRLPGDLHAQELQGRYRQSWNASEIRTSYRLGFKQVKEVEL